MSVNFKDIHNILVIKLRHIGDVLLTVPVFRALKETFPEAKVSALVNKGTEEVLLGNPLVSDILVFDRDIKKARVIKKYTEEIRFLKRIRERHFDMTVDLTGGDRAAIISFLSGARYRIGWESLKGFVGKRFLYTHLYRPDGQRHMVLQNLDVLKRFGISTDNLAIDIFIPDEARQYIGEIFKKYNIKPNLHPIIHIHPTSRWLFKCWKDEYMAEIISWLLHKGFIVIVTSSPDRKEIERVKGIISLSQSVALKGKLIDLSGKTTIKELAAISEASDLFFGVDSAPMHIAAALGTPVIALFGPTGQYSWGPWDNKGNDRRETIHRVIQRGWDCVPCGKDGCKGSKISRCLMDIKPEEVKELMEGYFANLRQKTQQ